MAKAPRSKSKVVSTPVDKKTQAQEARATIKALRDVLSGLKADLKAAKATASDANKAVKAAQKAVDAQAKAIVRAVAKAKK